jgi:hypothetical protein
VLRAEGYERREGSTTVPSAPGFGLSVDEKAFADDVKIRFDVSA